MIKKSLLLTNKMCLDFISTYELQENKNITETQFLFLLICKYVSKRDISLFKNIKPSHQRFFVSKIKNVLDEENFNHIEKSKKRMILADEKKKLEDKKNNKENKYKVNFEKIKPITKFTLYYDDLSFILNELINEVKGNFVLQKDNFFLLMYSVLPYFLKKSMPKTDEFLNSYVGLVFLDIKKDIDKHEELYNTKIENRNKKATNA